MAELTEHHVDTAVTQLALEIFMVSVIEQVKSEEFALARLAGAALHDQLDRKTRTSNDITDISIALATVKYCRSAGAEIAGLDLIEAMLAETYVEFNGEEKGLVNTLAEAVVRCYGERLTQFDREITICLEPGAT